MFTLAITLFGIKIINLHWQFSTYLGTFIAGVLNSALASLPKPLEFQDNFGLVAITAVLGPEATVSVAVGSKAATLVASGTVVTGPTHPDVTVEPASTPAPAPAAPSQADVPVDPQSDGGSGGPLV